MRSSKKVICSFQFYIFKRGWGKTVDLIRRDCDFSAIVSMTNFLNIDGLLLNILIIAGMIPATSLSGDLSCVISSFIKSCAVASDMPA